MLGLVEKGQQGILALRFRNYGDLARYAKAHGHDKDWDLQRWKISGLPTSTGLVGLSNLLNSLGWDLEEVVYQDADHAVFTSAKKGIAENFHYNVDEQPRTVRFKALNSIARKAAADESKTARKQLLQPSKRAAEQKKFPSQCSAAAKAASPKQTAVQPAPASPRSDASKQKATGRTGETPPGQQSRQM